MGKTEDVRDGGSCHQGARLDRISFQMQPNIESVSSIIVVAEQRLDKHQRRLETFTATLGRPRTFYGCIFGVFGWVGLNVALLALGRRPVDPPPFFWLQGAVALSALLMTTLVLITANRQTRNAEERAHLDLQVNLLAEQKVAKLIALVEELRRDLPMVKDRVDHEANAMQEAIDPHAMLAALEEVAHRPSTDSSDP